MVNHDEHRVHQVINNLLNNAVKYTNEGYVRVDVDARETSDSRYEFVISIVDSGIGIPEEKIAEVRRVFASPAEARGTVGEEGWLGLGLTLCHRLVRFMGGSLQVRSTPGQGSTFEFTFSTNVKTDLHQVDAGNAPAGPIDHDLKILVAEDNYTNLLVIRSVLEKLGFHPVTARNGREAVDMALQEHFDLILMDCQMPIMDGYEATRRIRQMGGQNPPYIAALTAGVMEQDRRKCTDAGMDGFVAKPVNKTNLLRTIREFEKFQMMKQAS